MRSHGQRTCATRHAVGRRLRGFAAEVADATEDPRWGRVGRRRIVDRGPLPPQHPRQGTQYTMETFDEVIRDRTIGSIGQAVSANKPFFVWMNPTRMHVVAHLSRNTRPR